MSQQYLKSRVRIGTRTFVVAGGLVLAWLNLGMPTSLTTLLPSAWASWMTSGAVALVAIFAAALDSVPGHDNKARLVFWRWKHPLPGSRAFDKANMTRDTRIDRERLKSELGGTLPRSAADQNSTWYKLYKRVEHDPRVDGSQFDFLLFRDLTWFAVLLAVAALVCSVANPVGRIPSLWAGASFAVLALMFSRAAAERGLRFVNTVLALVSSEPSKNNVEKAP
jgi:hypothetical protein